MDILTDLHRSTMQTACQVHHIHYPCRANQQNIGALVGWTKLSMKWSSLVATQQFQITQQVVDRLNLHGSTVQIPHGSSQGAAYPTYQVLGWHYAQCIVRVWGTAEYKQVANISWKKPGVQLEEEESDDE